MRESLRAWTGVFVAVVVLGAGVPLRLWEYRGGAHLSKPDAAAVPPTGSKGLFVDVTGKAGISYVHQELMASKAAEIVGPLLAGLVGASASVVDFDGDGWPDIYLTSPRLGALNALYRNNHDGTFTDVAGKAGLADVNRKAASLRSLWFDADNDGRADLLLTTTYCPAFFRNLGGGRFREVAGAAGIGHCGYSYASNVFDFDRDGFLDVIVADYYGDVDFLNLKGELRTSSVTFSVTYADNGGPILVYRNKGDGTFETVPGALGLKSRGWTHAVGVYDLRGKGAPDLFFATDFNADQIYYFENGRYVDAGDRLAAKFSHFGMSAEIADVDNDGSPSIYATDIYEPGYTTSTNTMWKRSSDGRWRNVALSRRVGRCGWSWGAKFVDLDRDGLQDLLVTNGFISQNRKKDFWFKVSLIFSGDARLAARNSIWPKIEDHSWSGYQRDCVYRNVGGRFEDITEGSGFDEASSDGRAVSVLDYLNDGSLGVVVASKGGPTRLYRVAADPANAWIGFNLIGGPSNRDAFGAKVSLKLADGRTLTREIQPANGFQSQSDRRLLIGLGRGAVLLETEIRWPSGRVQKLEGLALGRYHVAREPKS